MSRHFSPYLRFIPLMGLVLSLFGLSAEAATFTVTNLNDSGPGSLRQVILDADMAVGDDTIVFQSGLSGTITLTSGRLTINSNLAINGPGSNVLAVSGNNISQVFVIGTECSSPTVTIDGLTIKDGSSVFSPGGGIFNGGGTLTVSNSTVSGNLSGEGGGIAVFTILCVSENVSGKLIITNSTVSGNSAVNTLNPDYGFGGGIAIGLESTAMIINSTLSGNSASGSGGGIGSGGTLTIRNSTISGNSSNSSNSYGGGGILNGQGGTLTLGNNIVAGNTAPMGKEITNITFSGGPGSPPGIIISKGYNLVGENGVSGVEGATLSSSDIVPTVGISAILAPLGDYGGPTQTHLLVPDSPAINAGDNALIPAGVTTDQRGFPRIQNDTVDIGAVEVGSTTEIPTLSQWALLLGGLLLGGIAWRAQMRKTEPL